MNRYRQQFKEIWFEAEKQINKDFNKIISKTGETESDEGQSYLFRKRMIVRTYDKLSRPKTSQSFSIKIEFNVTDESKNYLENQGGIR